MRFRGGEFSTGTMGNFQPELTQLISICCGRDSQELSTHTGPVPACLLSLTRTRSLRPYISSTIPFSFIFLWTLLRVFALTKNSTPLF